jgi:dihydrolipoamide dehydrogenase
MARQRKCDRDPGAWPIRWPEPVADGHRRRTARAQTISFDHAIVAVGSQPVIRLPGFQHDDPRVMDSTGALELADVSHARLLVVGGGIIGLEMGDGLPRAGLRQVTVVELMDQLIPGCDADLVKPLHQAHGRNGFENIHLKTRRHPYGGQGGGHWTCFSRARVTPEEPQCLDKRAGGHRTAPERQARHRRWTGCGVQVDERGFVPVDKPACAPMCRTSSPSATSSAIPCWRTRQPMRARSPPRSSPATRPSLPVAMTIPSVAYTDPELAWVGRHRDRGQGARASPSRPPPSPGPPAAAPWVHRAHARA